MSFTGGFKGGYVNLNYNNANCAKGSEYSVTYVYNPCVPTEKAGKFPLGGNIQFIAQNDEELVCSVESDE